ncbi:MAG: peptidyl-alpha-hydroxyglycine alpha-amidating lyase family protein [Armatimonadetes bacterium]|nr:peptidyl-alpha-hydroxyglycine alpha-amidating lyase family protein [Armatimonadota bacterium]MDW8122600.1 peptidyl-alpha-hydroxyglycine alpha-amidating lyase family protein [Armatimonadota bacterium]
MSFGDGKFRYEVVEGWFRPLKSWKVGQIAAVACDSKDRVFLYCRSDHPLLLLSKDGELIAEWGQEILKDAHGLWIDENDFVYCTDRKSHCVFVFDRSGKLIRTFGRPGIPGEEGAPFNEPTDCVTVPPADGWKSPSLLFVADGYRNSRIHKFLLEGQHLQSWGAPGTGPGEFHLPHSVRVDPFSRVWVCDRENNRIQIFDTNGKFLEERKGLHKPCCLYIDGKEGVVYVAELERRVSVWTLDGQLITHWGGGKPSEKPGEFLGGPHGIWVDSEGSLYVSEVLTDERIQKFVRVG